MNHLARTAHYTRKKNYSFHMIGFWIKIMFSKYIELRTQRKVFIQTLRKLVHRKLTNHIRSNTIEDDNWRWNRDASVFLFGSWYKFHYLFTINSPNQRTIPSVMPYYFHKCLVTISDEILLQGIHTHKKRTTSSRICHDTYSFLNVKSCCFFLSFFFHLCWFRVILSRSRGLELIRSVTEKL